MTKAQYRSIVALICGVTFAIGLEINWRWGVLAMNIFSVIAFVYYYYDVEKEFDKN